MTDTLDITVGDLSFHARADGPEDGPLVLLMHGFPQTAHTWRAQLPVLAAAGYRAVAPNQRGYSSGARPEGIEHYKTGTLVADIFAMADALGHQRFHLVGHDWGGALSWIAAGRHPERLKSLTVLSRPHPDAFARAMAEGCPVDNDIGLFWCHITMLFDQDVTGRLRHWGITGQEGDSHCH